MQNDDSTKKTRESALEEIKPAEIKDGQLILTDAHKKLIKEQIAPNATAEELQLFFMMAHRTRLDPLLQQLYFIKYGQGDRAKVSYVTSIDGYRIIAHRTGEFDGIDEPRYQMNNSGQLESCSITVYRKDSERGFSATVYFNEYNTSQNLWAKMPMTMIAKVAEAHALRKAFPQDLSGVYTTDEMDQASIPAKTAPTQARPSTAPSRQSNATASPQKQYKSSAKASEAQVRYIHKLLKDKNKSVEPIYETLKVNSLNDISKTDASTIIDRLNKVTADVQEAEIVSEDKVDVDEVADGMEKKQKEEISDYDRVKRATNGDIKFFEIIVNRRAKQLKKNYETVLANLLEKFNVVDLKDMTSYQVKVITDQVMEMNKAHEAKADKEADEVAEIVGGERTN